MRKRTCCSPELTRPTSQSMWFTREEQSVLTSLWYCQTGVSLMVSIGLSWSLTVCILYADCSH